MVHGKTYNVKSTAKVHEAKKEIEMRSIAHQGSHKNPPSVFVQTLKGSQGGLGLEHSSTSAQAQKGIKFHTNCHDRDRKESIAPTYATSRSHPAAAIALFAWTAHSSAVNRSTVRVHVAAAIPPISARIHAPVRALRVHTRQIAANTGHCDAFIDVCTKDKTEIQTNRSCSSKSPYLCT